MPFLSLLRLSDTVEPKRQAIDNLLENSSHTKDYYVLLVGAVLLAIGGIIADSIPTLIASMIVAPLAYPILTMGLAITVGDLRLLRRTAGLLVVSCAVALGIAILVTLLFNEEDVKDVYVTFTENRILATAVAVVAGAIAAYGLIRPKVATAITGVAIAVSLMPPLVATGIGLAGNNRELIQDAGSLFLLNFIGILLASIIMFVAFSMGREYKKTTASVIVLA
jgi:uncharacterized hydrophobic protein (TIGR00271 family)